MKQLKLICLSFLFATSLSHAQWQVQLDNQNFSHLGNIFFLDENTGWVIGDEINSSPYFYTTDSGQNWLLSEDWWDVWGTDIAFVNHDTGFIASSNGIIFKTVNSGQDWTEIQTPATQDVLKLCFVDENNWWAVLSSYSEGYILHTDDGFNSIEFQKVFESNTSQVEVLFFINDSLGFAGGSIYDYVNNDTYIAIMKTQNKGASWDTVFISNNLFYWLQDIFFIDTNKGWSVGQKSLSNSYLILKTNDGGETWQEDSLPELTTFYGNYTEASFVHSMFFINDTLGWLTCSDEENSGYILLSNNGGESWQQQFVNYEFNKPIYDICAVDENNAWAVGADFIYHNNNADTIVFVNENELVFKKDLIQFSPNPCSETLSIQNPNKYKIETISISDISGKIHFYETQDIGDVLELGFLQKDIYFITINFIQGDQNYSLTKKIVKL